MATRKKKPYRDASGKFAKRPPPKKKVKAKPKKKVKTKPKKKAPRDAQGRFIKREKTVKRERQAFHIEARDFLDRIRLDVLTPLASQIRQHKNPDGSMDLELRFREVPIDLDGFIGEVEGAYWDNLTPNLSEYWVRMAIIWDPIPGEVVATDLPYFRGKETTKTNITRKTPDAGLVFEAARNINSLMRGKGYEPSHLVLRLYYHPKGDKPLY